MLYGAAFAQDGVFAAPTLPALLRQTLATHPTIVARQAELGAARAEVEAARWQFWPTPAVTLERADRPAALGLDSDLKVLSLRQPLWTAGRLQAGVAQAEAGVAASAAGREERRRDLALELIQAYGDAHTADTRARAYEKSLQVHERLLAQVRRRTDEGLSTPSDVALAEGRRDAVLAERELAQAQREVALQKLRSLSGLALSGTLAPIGRPESSDVSPADATAAALGIDPGLERLDAESRALRAETARSRAALWPTVFARVEQRHGDITGSTTRMLLGVESQWSAGLANASQIEASVRRQDARLAEAEARRRRVDEQVSGDVRLLGAAHARARALAAAATSSEAVSASWDRQFLAGRKTWQEVMNAAREVAQAEVQLADAQGAAAVTAWRLAVLTRGVDAVQNGSAP